MRKKLRNKRLWAVLLVVCMMCGQTAWAKEVNMMPGDNGVAEKAEASLAGEIDVREIQLYLNYDVVGEVQGYSDANEVTEKDFQVSVTDAAICSIDQMTVVDGNVSFIFHGKEVGTTAAEIYNAQNEKIASYMITVDALPNDAASIPDTALRSKMLVDPEVDRNEDSYISNDEIKKIDFLNLSKYEDSPLYDIESLKGLEKAENLYSIYLRYQSKISNIDVLFLLPEVEHVDLQGTSVPDGDRWKMADIRDMVVNKGEKIDIPRKGAIFEESEFSLEVLENAEFISIEATDSGYNVIGLKPGSVKLHAVYRNLSTDFTIRVEGLNSSPDLGGIYDGTVKVIMDYDYFTSEEFQGGESYKILNSNGELWQTFPEIKKVGINVAEYKGGYFGSKVDGEFEKITFQYTLDKSGNLYSKDRVIATNVVEFVGEYALSKDGILKDLYRKESKQIEKVKDWVYIRDGEIYVLKNDGTLWHRTVEIINRQMKESMQQIGSNVIEISRTSFLCADGAVYDFVDPQTCITKQGKHLTDYGEDEFDWTGWFEEPNLYGYYGMDDKFYVLNLNDDEKKEYRCVGNLEVKQMEKRKNYDSFGRDYCWIILTTDGDVYRYSCRDVKLEKIDTGVKTLSEESWEWVYQKEDGTYYDLDGKALGSREEPLKLGMIYGGGLDPYLLNCQSEGNDGVVVRNGVEIIDYVDQICGGLGARVYAIRKDGIVWDITGIPKEVIDLAKQDYLRGDVNGDSVVNIEDLRIVLRGVCGKVELTENQIKMADVVEDGKVDIQDLRKELRYVCGKITEL